MFHGGCLTVESPDLNSLLEILQSLPPAKSVRQIIYRTMGLKGKQHVICGV